MFVSITLLLQVNLVLCVAAVVLAVLVDILRLAVLTKTLIKPASQHHVKHQQPVKLVCLLWSLVLPAQV